MWLWPSLLMYSIAAAELKFVINGTRLVSAPCPFVSDSHATRVQGGADVEALVRQILAVLAAEGSGGGAWHGWSAAARYYTVVK